MGCSFVSGRQGEVWAQRPDGQLGSVMTKENFGISDVVMLSTIEFDVKL